MKYDVYGVGNALVDTEYEVNDNFLMEHRIAKGIVCPGCHIWFNP